MHTYFHVLVLETQRTEAHVTNRDAIHPRHSLCNCSQEVNTPFLCEEVEFVAVLETRDNELLDCV